MRKGLPTAVTAAAIDWFIEQNLDKYKTQVTSQSKQPRTNSFIIAFVILLASLPILFFRYHCKNLAKTTAFLIGAALYTYALSNRCQYCKTPTENAGRICNECQIRLDTEEAKAKERKQEQEGRTRSDKKSEREHAAGENGFDPYQVLGIARDASKEEIKTAYFNLIKQYHPDKVSHLGQEFQKLADEKAQLINRAYQILMAN
jgi:uncharacterized Zn finger protein (UPF0148 family)